MSKNKRYKFASSYSLKQTHKRMIKRFEGVRAVSTNKMKDDSYTVYFSLKNDRYFEPIRKHFNKIGIELVEIS